MPDVYQGPGEIQWNGSTLAEAKNVKFSIMSGGQDVATMAKGWAGSAPSFVKTTLTIEEAVPLAGLEADFVEALVKGSFIDVTVAYAGKRYSWTAKIESVDGEMSIENPSNVSLSLTSGAPRIT